MHLDAVQLDAVNLDAVQPSAVKLDTVKPDAVKLDAAKPDAARLDAMQLGVATVSFRVKIERVCEYIFFVHVLPGINYFLPGSKLKYMLPGIQNTNLTIGCNNSTRAWSVSFYRQSPQKQLTPSPPPPPPAMRVPPCVLACKPS